MPVMPERKVNKMENKDKDILDIAEVAVETTPETWAELTNGKGDDEDDEQQ